MEIDIEIKYPLLPEGMTIDIYDVPKEELAEEVQLALEAVGSDWCVEGDSCEGEPIYQDRLGRSFNMSSVLVYNIGNKTHILHPKNIVADLLSGEWDAKFHDGEGYLYTFCGQVGKPVRANLYVLCDDFNEYEASRL